MYTAAEINNASHTKLFINYEGLVIVRHHQRLYKRQFVFFNSLLKLYHIVFYRDQLNFFFTNIKTKVFQFNYTSIQLDTS